MRSIHKCDLCSALATRHAIFGLAIPDALAAALPLSTIKYTSEHRDLCRTHLADASTQFVHFCEFDLGMCPCGLSR